MSIQKTEAVILRRQELRETSLIITFYTKDFGKIKGIMRGVRGSRAEHIGGALEIFAHDSIVFYERKNGDVFTVSQCDLLDFFNPVRGSLERLVYAEYIIELLDSVTALGDKNTEVFKLLLNSLQLLSAGASPRRAARIFEIKLLSLLGLMPAMKDCANCGQDVDVGARFSPRNGGVLCKVCANSDREARPISAGTVKFIECVRSQPFERIGRIKVAHEVGKELEQILRKFLDYHVERRLKTVEFLKEIEKE